MLWGMTPHLRAFRAHSVPCQPNLPLSFFKALEGKEQFSCVGSAFFMDVKNILFLYTDILSPLMFFSMVILLSLLFVMLLAEKPLQEFLFSLSGFFYIISEKWQLQCSLCTCAVDKSHLSTVKNVVSFSTKHNGRYCVTYRRPICKALASSELMQNGNFLLDVHCSIQSQDNINRG